MIAIVSPTAARVAATAARPSSRRAAGSTRIFSAPEALVAQAQRRLRTLGGRQQGCPHEA